MAVVFVFFGLCCGFCGQDDPVPYVLRMSSRSSSLLSLPVRELNQLEVEMH